MTTVFVLIREHNVLDKALYKASYVCKLDHLYFIPYTHCFSFAFGGDQVAYMQTLHMSIFGHVYRTYDPNTHMQNLAQVNLLTGVFQSIIDRVLHQLHF